MNAEPLLALVAALLKKRRLPAVLIGNAAAALQGSPVTTMDLDFVFRRTPANLAKLKGLRGAELLVPGLRDIIRSKEAANRPQDQAVLPVIRKTLDEQEKA